MHWAIVISQPTGCRIVELLINGDTTNIRDEIITPIDYVPVATFVGELEDIDSVLQRQQSSMNMTYSFCFNNCQHFAATFLIHLHALAEHHLEKFFQPQPMYAEVTNVLKEKDGFLWHRPNILFYVGHLSTRICMVAANVASSAATATVTAPAQGLLGFFGATVTAPACYAGIAAFSVPLLYAAPVLAGGMCLINTRKWKRDTQFVDPRISAPYAT